MKFTLPYKGKIIQLIILGFISVGFSVLQPLPVKYIIDNVLSKQPLPDNLMSLFDNFGGVPDNISLLVVLVIFSIVLVVATSILSFISSNITTKICQKLVYDFSIALFNKLQKLSLGFYSKNNVGDLMQRVSADT